METETKNRNKSVHKNGNPDKNGIDTFLVLANRSNGQQRYLRTRRPKQRQMQQPRRKADAKNWVDARPCLKPLPARPVQQPHWPRNRSNRIDNQTDRTDSAKFLIPPPGGSWGAQGVQGSLWRIIKNLEQSATRKAFRGNGSGHGDPC